MLTLTTRSLPLLFLCQLLCTCAAPPKLFGVETGGFAASFDHYAINVEDLDRSVTFYREVFQLEEIQNGTEKPNIRWLSLGDGMSLHVIETDRSQLRLQKGVHLAVSVGKFDAFVQNLRDADIAFESWQGEKMQTNSRPDGVRQVYLQDPDGYWIEVNDGRTAWRRTTTK